MRGSSQASRLRGVYGLVARIMCLYRTGGVGTPKVDAVIRVGRMRTLRDVIAVFLSLRWGSPSQQENSSHHHLAATPALRSRTHVPAFALAVYWHDPDGTLIVSARFPGSTAWGCRGRFHGALVCSIYCMEYITEDNAVISKRGVEIGVEELRGKKLSVCNRTLQHFRLSKPKVWSQH